MRQGGRLRASVVGVVGVGRATHSWSQTRAGGWWDGWNLGGGASLECALGQAPREALSPLGLVTRSGHFAWLAPFPLSAKRPRHPWIWQARASTSLGHPQKPAEPGRKAPQRVAPSPKLHLFPFFPAARRASIPSTRPTLSLGNSMRAQVRAGSPAREASCVDRPPSLAGLGTVTQPPRYECLDLRRYIHM